MATSADVLLGCITFATIFTYCTCAEGHVNTFRCYTASKPCTRGVKMVRMKECVKYRGRCMERVYPKNVTECCAGVVGKYCDNYLKDDEYYFMSDLAGDTASLLQQRPQGLLQDRRGPKGEKGDRGPEGFFGMPGQKGDPGMPAEKGQKGEPGKSIKGKHGKMGRKGKTGRRGRKGDPGPMGPRGFSGMPGLPGPRGITKTESCNCSGLVSRVADLENLVRSILNGTVSIPLVNQAPRRQAQEYPVVDHPQQAVRGSQVSDRLRTPSPTTTETTTLNEIDGASEMNTTTLPPVDSTDHELENIEHSTTLSDQDVNRVEETTTMLTTSTTPTVKCNNSYTVPDCRDGKLCKMAAPVFLNIPPPLPNITDLSSTYLNSLSCCSRETLNFALNYYKSQFMLK